MASHTFSSFLPSSIRKNNDIVAVSSDTEEELQKTPSATGVVSEDQTASNIESSASLDVLRRVRVADPDEPIVPFPPLSSLDAASTDSSTSAPDSLQEFINTNKGNPTYDKTTQKTRYPFSSFFSSFTSSRQDSIDSSVSDKRIETHTTESETAEQVLGTDGACIVPELDTEGPTPSVPKV